MDPQGKAAVALALAALAALLARRARALSAGGAVAAAAVGASLFWGAGLFGAAVLLAFFVPASVLTRWGPERGSRTEDYEGRRASQVLANGGLAAAAALLAPAVGTEIAKAAIVGCLAAMAADTWATEVGTRFGGQPRLVVGWRPVPPGRSGGVTLAGSLGGLAGASVVGVAAALFEAPLAGGGLRAAVVAGVGGMIIDSLIGAKVQGLWRCRRCGRETERPRCGCSPEAQLDLISGWPWLGNDLVNLAASTAGAVLGILAR